MKDLCLEKIGTTRREICGYDNKEHETQLTDYLIILSGNTYINRHEIKCEDFMFDGLDKEWHKNVESEDEVYRLFNKFSEMGIKVYIRPIYRIMDI